MIRHDFRLLSLFACVATALLVVPGLAAALISPADDAVTTRPPPDDPGWANVGHRLGGPTVIYLGNGWVLTAHHVGAGVVMIGGLEYYNVPSTLTRFTNPDGSEADLIAYAIVPGPKEPPMPELPILPIRTAPPMPGEQVVLVGTGRSAGAAVEVEVPGIGLRTGFASAEPVKRWGTNRVEGWPITVEHADSRHSALVTSFDAPDSSSATPYEAGAATGDSGGAVFALRNPADPSQGWALAGIMSSVSAVGERPKGATLHGDITFSVDLSQYRDQIVALVRPECSNEVDDDGDGHIDHPADRDCESMADAREAGTPRPGWRRGALALTLAGVALAGGTVAWRARREPGHTS